MGKKSNEGNSSKRSKNSIIKNEKIKLSYTGEIVFIGGRLGKVF